MAGFENEIPALPLDGTLRKLSVEEGNEILAKAWQRFSDPVFVRHLLGSLDLSQEELQESLQALERLRPCRDGRARA